MKPVIDKPKHGFVCFVLGLLVGFWPMRWVAWVTIFLAGFFLGNTYNLLKTLILLDNH